MPGHCGERERKGHNGNVGGGEVEVSSRVSAEVDQFLHLKACYRHRKRAHKVVP